VRNCLTKPTSTTELTHSTISLGAERTIIECERVTTQQQLENQEAKTQLAMLKAELANVKKEIGANMRNEKIWVKVRYNEQKKFQLETNKLLREILDKK